MIAPMIFCTVVIGNAGMEDMKKVGKTGGLAMLYFEGVDTFAMVIGLVLVKLMQEITLLSVLLMTSKGAVGVTESGRSGGDTVGGWDCAGGRRADPGH
ncbi:Aerobic C4-dicarboxylate transporter for fumarate, L-malate, D-malate, succunate, aspartate [Polaromonas sp. CG9_12]|nr:Aerobic C4-dicarboxylate transporter for fumarate, L-malate, D-malate, succunate, aspartate [Polaromonas sp. CG9_12]